MRLSGIRQCLLAIVWVAIAVQAQAAAPGADAPRVQTLKITVLSTMLADRGIGEWGFAALVEADGHRILFDTGAHPRTVLDNARELGIDLSGVEDVVLSHFHDDHTGGLMSLRRELARTNPAALSRAHVARGIFLPRRGDDDGNTMIAVRREYEASGGRFIEYDKPAQMFPALWLTGPVPRVYPEKNYGKGLQVLRDGKWIDDDVPDDQSLIIETARGRVVLTGCGHAGIANILHYARTFAGDVAVHALVGGLHLFDASDAQLEWTAAKLKEYRVANLLGAHCTGIESVYRLRASLHLTRKTCVVATIGAVFDLVGGMRTGDIAR